MKDSINKQSYDMWLQDTSPLSLSEDTFKIKVPDDVARRHITDVYHQDISNALKKITGIHLSCEFIIGDSFTDNNETNTTSSTGNLNINTYKKTKSLALYPKYIFENFVVGPNNQLAHAAATSVSNSPATQFNPLFIYGETGLGKTHLLQAIAHSILKTKPYLKILYVTSEQFINEFIQAIRKNTLSSFKINYRDIDVLLIDDIQFIEKKEQTQEEFFHTFNTLHNNKKQIIISSDRPPKELSTLEDRLKSRFAWGLIADIQTPNLETREAILKNKAEKEKMNIPEEVLNYLARRIKSSIRALEAALIRLNVVSSLYNEPISLSHAKTHLKHLFDDETEKKVTISDIMKRISEKYEVTVDDIMSKSRHSRIVMPRFIAIYLSRKLTKLTTIEIGKEFGNRDHSTVLNAMNNVEKLIKEEEDIREMIEDIILEFKS